MSGNGNTVKLTFVGDDDQLQRTFKAVDATAKKTGDAVASSSKHIGEALEGNTRNLRGTADVIDGLSTSMGGNAGQALMMTRGLADLSDGLGVLTARLGAAKIATAGVVAAIATAGVAVAAHIDHTSMMNEVERTAADTTYYLAKGVSFLGQGIPFVGNKLADLANKADQWSQSAHGAAGSTYDLADALAKLNNQKRIAGTFGIADQNPGGDGFVDQAALDMMELDPAKLQKQYGLDSSGNPLKTKSAAGGKSSLDKAAEALKAKLATFQSIADKYSQVASQIADALSPKLIAGDPQNVVAGTGTGQTFLQKLNQQLKDTLHLKSDLARLSKAGLDADLLTQLTQGGLGSLGVADELLGSGKAGIAATNRTARAINRAGGSIAGTEAAREIKNQDKKFTLTVDLSKASQTDFERFFAKMIQTKGPGTFGLKAA